MYSNNHKKESDVFRQSSQNRYYIDLINDFQGEPFRYVNQAKNYNFIHRPFEDKTER